MQARQTKEGGVGVVLAADIINDIINDIISDVGSEAKAKGTVEENVEQVDPGLGDADHTPGFGPLKVSPLSYALSQQNLYYDCSGEARGKGHCQHRQPPGRANLESFRLRTGSNRTAASLQREYP